MLLFFWLACGPDGGPKAAPPAWCEAEVQGRQELDAPLMLDVFPDETWSIADPSTVTGRRLHLGAAADAFPENYADLARQLEALDGFGLAASIYLRFTGPLDPALYADLRLVALAESGPEEREFDLELLDAGATLMLTPRVPMPPATPMVVALINPEDPSAPCVSPAPALRDQLWPAGSTREQPLAARYEEALEAVGVTAARIGGLTIFTTQSLAVEEAVLATIRGNTPTFTSGECVDGGLWRRCTGTVSVSDFRDSSRSVPDASGVAWSEYDLPTAVWLPAGAPAPAPAILCGHGLGGDREQCDFLADLVAPAGLAVIATDAQEHGDHPARSTDGTELESTLALFGVVLSPAIGLDALALRDNFRASAWDRIQVVRAVTLGLDADGDGVDDLDPAHLAYAGVSLGGIMGPQVLAGAPELSAGALVVPGGALLSIVTESPSLGVLVDLMRPIDYSDDDVTRTVQILQTLVDAGDPLVFGALLSERRATGGPDVLEMIAVNDSIVPNISSARLAQALGLPGVGTEWFSIPGVSFAAGDVRANLEDGRSGGVVLCMSTTPFEGAPVEAADHSSLHESVEGIASFKAFLEPALAGVVPTIPDVCSDG